MDRRAFLGTLAGGLLTVSCAAEAQPARHLSRVGVLSSGNSVEPVSVQREPFEQGLRELGWTSGSNIIIEYRYAEGRAERLPALAAELVRLKVEVIVARGPQATQAARNATRTIPIVMSATDDPVRSGFVASLARPGGNITGLAFQAQGELDGKRLELLKETIPGLAHVALLVNWVAVPDQDGTIRSAIQRAARLVSLEVQTYEVNRAQDIAEAFTAIGTARVGAVLVRPDPSVLEPDRAQVVALALLHRLAAMYPWQLYVDAGGLMSYATSIPAFHRRSAFYVDKILKGAKLADLPIEQPTKFELVINLKTAKALGLTIPPSLLLRADQVIE